MSEESIDEITQEEGIEEFELYKTIADALSSLDQKIDDSKAFIANAIGEPLNPNQTFQAMSSDINGLLSTFKANMMNNGVTVESNDKFKSLIDKIATMVEEGEGKGIQYAEGSISKLSVGVTGNLPTKKTIPYTTLGLDFKPTILFIYVDTITGGSTDYFKETVNSMDNYSDATSCHGQYYNGSYFMHRMYISNITDNSFDLYTYTDLSESSFEVFLNNVKWYAIGVGEEDTTLRDSLASILTEEGVSIAEEDDMASLIAKVDSEFDRQVVPAGDAVASDVLSGKTFMNNSGELLTGNVTKMSEYTQITSGNVNNNGAAVYISIPSGAYTTPSVLGKPEIFLMYKDLDANLVPENIVSGKSICGVTGTAKTVPTIVSGTTNTIYTSEVKQYSSGIYSDSSNTWSTSWYINTSKFDQLYMNYSNIKNVSITFQYMCDVGNIYAYCSNVILTKGYSTIATLCTSNCYIDDGGYWYNNVDPITVTLDQLNGATVQLSGAYCTSQPTYIVQVRYVIRGNIQ